MVTAQQGAESEISALIQKKKCQKTEIIKQGWQRQCSYRGGEPGRQLPSRATSLDGPVRPRHQEHHLRPGQREFQVHAQGGRHGADALHQDGRADRPVETFGASDLALLADRDGGQADQPHLLQHWRIATASGFDPPSDLLPKTYK